MLLLLLLASEDPLFYHWGPHFAPGPLASLLCSQLRRLTLAPGTSKNQACTFSAPCSNVTLLVRSFLTISLLFLLFFFSRGEWREVLFLIFIFSIVATPFLNAGNHSHLWPFLFKNSYSSCSPSGGCPLPRPSPVLFFSIVFITFWQTVGLIYLCVYVLSVPPMRAGIYVCFCLMLTLLSLE